MTQLGDPRLLPRFWDKVSVAESGCWIWTAQTSRDGYGRFAFHGRKQAHRVAYECLVGPIPDGLQIDHLCRVRNCVNPKHMEPVTPAINSARSPINVSSINRDKTHCVNGHPFDETNTYMWRGKRVCRACNRAAVSRRAARRRDLGAQR